MDCVVTGRAKALGNYLPLEFAEPEERPGREPVEKRGTAKRDPGRIEDIESSGNARLGSNNTPYQECANRAAETPSLPYTYLTASEGPGVKEASSDQW